MVCIKNNATNNSNKSPETISQEIKTLSSEVGKFISIAFVFGLARLLGDFVIKTALIKMHLWYVFYYSDLIRTALSLLQFL